MLAGYVTHPNVAGATVVGLGCQKAQIDMLIKAIHKRDKNFDKPLYSFSQQESQSEQTLIAQAIESTFIGLSKANECRRTAVSMDKLVMGVECGGSDGFSGISANPAIGYASDCLVGAGGSVILSEFPELCGTEQAIIDRCATPKLVDRFNELMLAYNDRAKKLGSGFDMNPSFGNIKDGLITDAIKSAGAVEKGGKSPVIDILDYTEPVTKKGLSLLCTPGNDVESTTGMAASGANIILFSTGLGTPTGNPIVPVIKVSTSTTLYKALPDIIDMDAGAIITGEKTVKDLGEDMLSFVLDVASAKKETCATALGQDDFLVWKRGISL